MSTTIIIGLGNPGKEYEKTRHNAGFMFLDYFFDKFRDDFGLSDWEFSKKIDAEMSIGKQKSKKIILLKPQTFMNLSGKAVASAKKFYKLKLEDIVVAQDEIDLPLGTFRFSKNSSSAGHRGIQNIIDSLKSQNFTRLRIGIANKKGHQIPTQKYVLGKFTDKELIKLKEIFKKAAIELEMRL